MRTIKSQDGKMIVNVEKLENVRFIDNDVENKHVIVIEFGCALNSYADYSTEKRALRVLDMLNEWLNQSTITTHQFERYAKAIEAARKSGQYFQARFNVSESACFVMPQDSEELDA